MKNEVLWLCGFVFFFCVSIVSAESGNLSITTDQNQDYGFSQSFWSGGQESYEAFWRQNQCLSERATGDLEMEAEASLYQSQEEGYNIWAGHSGPNVSFFAQQDSDVWALLETPATVGVTDHSSLNSFISFRNEHSVNHTADAFASADLQGNTAVRLEGNLGSMYLRDTPHGWQEGEAFLHYKVIKR